MDPDWDEVATKTLPPPGVHAHPTPASTLSFDTTQELLWAGNEYGRVSAFYGARLDFYTSFKAHSSQDGKVHQLLFTDKGVIALGSHSVHMALRRGPPIWHIRHEEMKELRCMTFTSKGTAEILVAGEQDNMLVIDVHKGEVTKQVPTKHKYKIMRRSRYICAATTGSTVHLLDPLTFNVVKIWNAQSASIHDMDAQHDFIVTCGTSPRQQGHIMHELLVNVFDPKTMQAMPPVGFPAGAAFVRMHPRMSSTSLVVSQNGQLHVVDLMNPNTTNIKQANSIAPIIMVDIAPSGEAVALANQTGQIMLWGSRTKIVFTGLANATEFGDNGDTEHSMDWNDDIPLNSVGMPYYRETLLSAWPPDAVYEVGAPPPKEDAQTLAGLQRRDWGLYGKNTRGLRRNQVEDTRTVNKEQSLLKVPKFLSEQARDASSHSPAGTPAPEETPPELPILATTSVLETHKDDVPEMYQRIEIQFSKFGIDDFDFGFYNSTQYAGLQNHIVNSYANALLQVMYFTPAIRNVALQHTATGCFEELCLLCELGFLFDMLTKAEGASCPASNLLKVLSYHPQAANLHLLDDRPHSSSRTTRLQTLARFILDKSAVDFTRIDPSPKVEQLLQTSARSSIKCQNCKSETTRDGSSFVHELMYPSPNKGQRHGKAPKTTFSQVLKKSVERETSSKGWCQNCHRYQYIATKKYISRIPDVFTLLAGTLNEESRKLWATPGWLPEEIGVITTGAPAEFFCYERDDLKALLARGNHQIAVYSLTGLAVDIDIGTTKGSHLVSMVNVAHSAPEAAPASSQWYLFNDFLVKPVTAEEALSFNTSWKTPSVITYELKEFNNKVDSSWKDHLDTRLLYVDLKPNLPVKTYKVLNPESEKMNSNTFIAIDTEFVSTGRPELEINSRGDYKTIRPVVHSLARTSVLRGSGEDEGVPFIDDYVQIRDPVQDYLTLWSGITAEDLDPHLSKHNLVPLKIAYKKMWILLNLGCKFVGHGLKQDFRVINMHVPRAQIVDTIDLFFLPTRKRKLSLQFLAWCLLKEDIQQGNHDSIEDARTALKLYRKYQEFSDAGILDAMLQDIYHKGTLYNFKPPTRQRTDTPGPASDGPTTPRKQTGAGPSGLSPGYTPGRSPGPLQ